jgi:hypothetical protein
MIVTRPSISLAVRNVAQHGDTDVFPYPLENHWFHDEEQAVTELLEMLDNDFDRWIREYPVVSANVLSGVGYAGFRAATQIDSIWNAYLLALLIEVGPDLEAARVPAGREVVFAYRFSPSLANSTLFHLDLGWGTYHKAALGRAKSNDTIVSTDISDFYPRIYHHRLENALNQATDKKEAVRRIMAIISQLSAGGTSYGLPVGGHAARMLAELVLNRTDRLLLTQGVSFVRFVDDYILFAKSRESIQSALVYLSEVLLTNEGLTLARSKTRFMTQAEFLRSSPLADPTVGGAKGESEVRRFLRLRLRYDPYSSTADHDYATLARAIQQFNVTKLLAREMGKSRVDERLIRQLIKSIRFMAPEVREAAVLSLVKNVEVLYPVFPTVVIVINSLLSTFTKQGRPFLMPFVIYFDADLILHSSLPTWATLSGFLRSTGLKKQSHYCALNFASKTYDIAHVCLVNPRLGVYLGEPLQRLCLELSGKTASEVMGEIVQYISDPIDRYAVV